MYTICIQNVPYHRKCRYPTISTFTYLFCIQTLAAISVLILYTKQNVYQSLLKWGGYIHFVYILCTFSIDQLYILYNFSTKCIATQFLCGQQEFPMFLLLYFYLFVCCCCCCCCCFCCLLSFTVDFYLKK